MTGKTSRIQKYMLFSKKIGNFGENYDLIEKKNVKAVDFFSCDFKFLMAPLDEQQNLC